MEEMCKWIVQMGVYGWEKQVGTGFEKHCSGGSTKDHLCVGESQMRSMLMVSQRCLDTGSGCRGSTSTWGRKGIKLEERVNVYLSDPHSVV